MKATGHGDEGRKLQKEGWSQRVPVVPGEYAGVHDHGKMAENNATNADNQKGKLMEKILNRDNLNAAYKKVKTNKGQGELIRCRWMNFYPI